MYKFSEFVKQMYLSLLLLLYNSVCGSLSCWTNLSVTDPPQSSQRTESLILTAINILYNQNWLTNYFILDSGINTTQKQFNNNSLNNLSSVSSAWY